MDRTHTHTHTHVRAGLYLTNARECEIERGESGLVIGIIYLTFIGQQNI